MNKKIRPVYRAMAWMLAAVIIYVAPCPASAAAQSPAQSPTVSLQPVIKQNATADKINGVICRVDTDSNGTAALIKVKSTEKKKITVSASMTVNGVKYTATVIGEKAFANCKKLEVVTLPDTIQTIQAKAFSGASKLKKIILTGKKAIVVRKNAFQGLKTEKMTVQVPKGMPAKQFSQLKKNLKAAGFKGKIVKAG